MYIQGEGPKVGAYDLCGQNSAYLASEICGAYLVCGLEAEFNMLNQDI